MPTVDDTIDQLFAQVDDKLLEGDFSTVDSWLEQLDVEALDVEMLIAWLSITVAAHSHLKKREAFVQRAEQHLRHVAPDRVDRLLQGLR